MSDQNGQVFVFDFDGVICDSTYECLISSWNTWQRWSNTNEFRTSPENFSNEEIDSFYAIRPRVRGAGEYFIVESMRSKGIQLRSQQQYDEAVYRNRDQIKLFKLLFYQERGRLQEFDFQNWLNLHSVYKDVCQFLENFKDSGRLYIATLKDRKSVSAILTQQGISLSEDHLLDESQIKSKLDALEKIRLQSNIKPEKITLFDDNILHLTDPKIFGYQTFLAAWGNVPEESINTAEGANIEVIRDFGSFMQNVDQVARLSVYRSESNK